MTFSLSKCRILLNLLFLLFLPYLLLKLSHSKKILVTFGIFFADFTKSFMNFSTFAIFHIARKILVTFAIFAKLALSSILF